MSLSNFITSEEAFRKVGRNDSGVFANRLDDKGNERGGRRKKSAPDGILATGEDRNWPFADERERERAPIIKFSQCQVARDTPLPRDRRKIWRNIGTQRSFAAVAAGGGWLEEGKGRGEEEGSRSAEARGIEASECAVAARRPLIYDPI